MPILKSKKVMNSSRNEDARNEVQLLLFEEAALRDQARAGDEAVTPDDLSYVHWAIEIAQLKANEEEKTRLEEARAELEAATDDLLDSVGLRISLSRQDVATALASLGSSVAELEAEVEANAHTLAMLVGEMSSTVDPSTTLRYEISPVGVRVDGQLVKNVRREVAVSVSGLVAHLIRPASPALADQLSQLARLGNGLPTTSPKKESA